VIVSHILLVYEGHVFFLFNKLLSIEKRCWRRQLCSGFRKPCPHDANGSGKWFVPMIGSFYPILGEYGGYWLL
jgi:hypothetical protein